MKGITNMTEQEHEYLIQRSGLNPLKFTGTLIASSRGRDLCPDQENLIRWHDINLYQTSGGKYILHIQYVSEWEGEFSHSYARQFAREELGDVLRDYNPIRYIMGFPPLPQYADKQRSLINWIKRRYDQQVVDLLAKFGDQFSETVD